VATVKTASSDHITIAVNPIRVAVREVMGRSRGCIIPGLRL
jgi:hypothetical protein